MILSTQNIHKSLISYFKIFKERISKLEIKLDLINTYNHPYMSKYTIQCENIIAIKFENMDDLTLGSRAGAFYKNVNEFSLHFQIFILSQVINSKDKDAYYTMFQIYSLLSDFIYENTCKLTLEQEEDDKYSIRVNLYIYPTTNMQNSGLVKIDSNYSNAAYCCSQAFKANVQVIEQLIREEK
ncbi:Putative cytosolic protein (plasmid) [Borrelia parkeri SLO]|uniref:Putative cytosolic protein n=1 Tax=Borrelia parkeri SLO TaxID=1313294 RepID=W5STL9_BORPR|nr:DUF764 family protein [Borrelia parkeri]AHH10043.1 Putative cytosolic protein [Borrelia parkeri SLO]UPA11036.1 DUF764 family protein [Borrelia parkeri]UPA11110.1 DUF764 family protein [Borrelia parkeri]UPA11131.1 DUF764 family protein [Borrelia parkeri]UPA11169.1 DUF764 family protein [Borrelia parkeri]